MSNDGILLRERHDTVVRLIMNRPEARNAMSLALIDQMLQAVEDLGADALTHVIVIAGAGPGFCAGHDLKELSAARGDNADGGLAFFEDTKHRCARLMMAIKQCPKPVIAEVHGIATAAGAQLVATCDLAMAAEDARFATPGVNIGLFCSTPMVAISRNIHRKQVMEMLLTGDLVEARAAKDMGLINRVVPTSDLTDATMALAAQIASKAPKTLKIGKEAFYRQLEMPLQEAYAYTAQIMAENMLEEDAKEGIDAFLEKRPARWKPI